MLRGIFVTGTDTNVGKTVVSAGLMWRYRGTAPLRYWKPVQSGSGEDDDTATVGRLAGCQPQEILDEGLRFPSPVSPHLAARRVGETIAFDRVLAPLDSQPAALRWIVEGAGGVLVPLNDAQLMVDLIARLGLPALVVSRTSLGTINHTLLTIETLDARSIPIAGVVMVGAPDAENRLAIERYGRVPVIGEMPVLDPLDPQALGAWARGSLDADGRLMEWLR
jgi:dethiobiotin synthase